MTLTGDGKMGATGSRCEGWRGVARHPRDISKTAGSCCDTMWRRCVARQGSQQRCDTKTWRCCFTGQNKERPKSGQERAQKCVWVSLSRCPLKVSWICATLECTSALWCCTSAKRNCLRGPQTRFAPSSDHFPDFPCFFTSFSLESSLFSANCFQPASKYRTKGCSRSSVDSMGARTLAFPKAFEPFLAANFGRH